MEHKCNQEDNIRRLEIDLAVAKSDIQNVKGDITDIKAKLNQFTWWFLSILVSIIGGLVTLYATLKK